MQSVAGLAGLMWLPRGVAETHQDPPAPWAGATPVSGVVRDTPVFPGEYPRKLNAWMQEAARKRRLEKPWKVEKQPR